MATTYLTRRATFYASHRLHSPSLNLEENVRIFGKCNNPNGHGHNYVLEVTVCGEVNPKTGMVFSLSDLKKIIDEAVVQKVDHKNLNLDVPEFVNKNPTAEVMVVEFWNLLQKQLPTGLLFEVKLYETENNTATYRGEIERHL